MTDLQAALGLIKARAKKATEGPWGYYTPQGQGKDPIFGATPGDEVALVKRPADWRFIAHARTDVPRLVAAIEAVLKMHRQVPLYGHEDDCTNTDEEHREEHFQSDGEFCCHELIEGWTCAECADVQDVASLAGPPEWPCPTVRALTDKLTGEDDEQ